MRLGVPSGHARPSIEALFRRAGLGIQPLINTGVFLSNSDFECVFVRAQDIPRYVEHGTLDCGLTGHDWIIESARTVVSVVELVCAKRGLGRNSWVLAVANESDYRVPEDVAGRVVATQLVKTTKQYFAARKIPVDVQFSWGPVETHLPVLGDAIVENTDAGVFLRSGQLRILETVLESGTELISSRQTWADAAKRREIENLALMLCSALHAEDRVGLTFQVHRKDLETALSILPPGQKVNISSFEDGMWATVNTVIEEASVWKIMPKLKAARAGNIVEFPLNKVLL